MNRALLTLPVLGASSLAARDKPTVEKRGGHGRTGATGATGNPGNTGSGRSRHAR